MKAVSKILLSCALLSLTLSSEAQQSAPAPSTGTPATPPAAVKIAPEAPPVETSTPAPASALPPPVPAVTSAPAPSDQPSAAQTPAAQTPAASDPLPPPTPLKLSSTYIIGPDDSIQVLVWKEPSLSGAFPVRPDGMISLPLIGDVSVAGRTPMDMAKELTEKLKKFIQDPTVTVSILSINSKRIFMAGEVGHIGPLQLTAAMTPLQAILASGGLSPYASKTKIYILREVNGKQTKIPFNYKKAIKDGDMQGITLMSGDTIVVP